MTPYQNGFVSFFLGRALEQNPYTYMTGRRKRQLHPYQRRFVDDKTDEAIGWERGWKKASEYSQNNRYPTEQEQMHLN